MNKTEQLEEIQHTLQQIFIKNLNFFKRDFLNLYEAIIQLENLHIENYSLEFIDNFFQLIDVHNKKKFYPTDPFIEAQHRLQNFDVSNAFAMIKLDSFEKDRHYNNEINAYEYLNQYIEQISSSKITPEVKKFIFIGTLLGVHINDFHTQYKADTYLIVEPNIEIFRLSMFMTDYEALSQDASLHFCIAQEQSGFNKIVTDFLNDRQEYNHLIHYELSHKEYEYMMSDLSLLLTQFSEMRYPFSEYILSLQRGYHYFLDEHKPILNLCEPCQFFNHKPLLFLGAGPSLGEHIQWVEDNKGDFIIVATSAALKQLELYSIAPDIVIIIEGRQEVITQFPSNSAIYKNSIFLSSIKVDPDVYKLFQNNPLFFMQNTLELFLENGFFSGITVGDVGIDVLLKLGANELYLLGIDAAISKTGETYVSTHPSSSSMDLTSKKESSSTDFGKDIHYVKGNFQEEVPTYGEYLEMIEHLNQRLNHLSPEIHIYNLSDGAYFNHTIPTQTQAVCLPDTFDKEVFHQTLHEFLTSMSKYTLNEKDIKSIQKEKKILKKILSLKVDNTIYKNFVQLKRKFKFSIVISIVNKYFNLTNPYYYFFNDREVVESIRQEQIQQLFEKLNSVYSKIKER